MVKAKPEILRYSGTYQAEWNSFVAKARNGHFMFNRAYMDYHSDRFTDHSLLVYQNHKLVALLPANQAGLVIYSHQGLTYGGLLSLVKATAEEILQLFTEILGYYKKLGVSTLLYKPLPYIFTSYPAQEDLYALFRVNAQLVKVELSSCLKLNADKVPKRAYVRKKRNRAVRLGCSFKEYANLSAFWGILEQVLEEMHQVAPVHTLPEMELLISRLPDNIRHFVVTNSAGSIVAGAVIFVQHNTVHIQYSANSAEGRKLEALTYLFYELIGKFTNEGYEYVNFGNSNEKDGQILNNSLSFYKESFGGRGVALSLYSIKL